VALSVESNLFILLSDALADAVEKAAASTVSVQARPRIASSGIAYSPDLVLTAEHSIERDDDIRVVLPDGSEARAAIAGRDAGSDLALLRLERPSLVPADIFQGEARVGQLVLAVGRPSSEGIQASQGVISYIGGPLQTNRGSVLNRFYRSDAIPYPGFSGGPMVDSSGRVIGINTTGFGSGVPISIPAPLAWTTAESLRLHGRIRRGFLGIRSQPVEIPAYAQRLLGRDQATGLMLVSVEHASPAEQGGLIIGDIITGLNGTPVPDHDTLLQMLTGDRIGTPAPVEILRAGQKQSLTVTIGEQR
jgi:S1-C subfamily serine protease